MRLCPTTSRRRPAPSEPARRDRIVRGRKGFLVDVDLTRAGSDRLSGGAEAFGRAVAKRRTATVGA